LNLASKIENDCLKHMQVQLSKKHMWNNENITKVKKTRKRKEHQGAKSMDVQ
jgi:hypothetical protein